MSPRTRERRPGEGGAQEVIGTDDHHDGTTARLPFDAEVELSVLAEAADPLHGLAGAVTAEDFYDQRNARIFAAVQSSLTELLSIDDRRYLEHAVQYAFPVVVGTLEKFIDLAARRRRLLELDAERLELLEGVLR